MTTPRQKPRTKRPSKPTPKPARYQGSAFLRDISRAVDEAEARRKAEQGAAV